MRNLDEALEGINVQTTVVMSDRQKGSIKAIEETLPHATEAYCAKHIGRKITTAAKTNITKSSR